MPWPRARENAPVNSETLLGLAGIGGTLMAAALGSASSLRQASIARQAAADGEDQKARRQVYGACATVLLARRDAVTALRKLFLAAAFDQAAATPLLAEIEALRADVARAVGAVMVEGPEGVARKAHLGGQAVEELARLYRGWAAEVAEGRTLRQLITAELDYANEEELEAARWVDEFAEECRKVLHPDEKDRLPLRYRLRSRLRRRGPW